MELIKFENKTNEQGHTYAILTFNRPKALNALNTQVLLELDQVFSQLEREPVRCLILTGEGKGFVAGADITEFQSVTPDEAQRMAERGQKLFSRLEKLPFPTIAAVNGFALGGGMELALSCDFIIASSNAKWGLPEVTLGLIPGYGGTQRLARKVGEGFAKRVALSGEMFTAEEGLRCGAFVEVVDPDKLMERVTAVALNICARAPIAVRMVKACIDSGLELGSEKGYVVEARAFSEVFKTADKAEGVSAFLEKRSPKFDGK